MRVCFITHDIAHIGGQERVLTLVANMLAERGIDVSILINSNKKSDLDNAYELSDLVKIVHDRKIARGKYSDIFFKAMRYWNKKICEIHNVKLLERIYFPLPERRSYEKFFKNNLYDVVIGVSPRPAGMLSLIDIPSRKVAWLHSTYHRYFLKKNDFQWHQEKLYEKLFPGLDDTIVLTDYDKKVYSDHFNILPKRIYNPVSYETEKLSSLTSNTILFVGRLHYDVKGLDYLLQITAELKKMLDKFEVVVVGDGNGKDKLIAQAKKCDVNKMIKMVGGTTDVKKYYEKASVCIVPSRVEGFGLVIIEAFESGVPVVAFENAGPSELIEDGKTGFLIPRFDVNKFADRLYKILDDAKLRRAMGAQAKRKAGEFSQKNIAEQWIRFLDRKEVDG